MALLISPTIQRSGFPAPGVRSIPKQAPLFGCTNHTASTEPKQAAKPQIDAIPTDKPMSALQKGGLKAIQWYQQRTRWVGKDGETKSMFPCPYCPSCSKYTFNAIAEFGVIKGILMGTYRIFFKCNPLTVGYQLIKYRMQNGKWPEKLRGFLPDTLPKAKAVNA